MYSKSIVCDIDDTISFTTNRDWENATPNLQLIQKLNRLYDEGWEINFFTARGSLSCNSREEAEQTYGPGIIEYFKKHGIKYHKLSFQKPLAQYYIDDKAITPEDFIELEIETLKGGLSGAFIERRGNKVFKTANNALDTAAWYNDSRHIIKTLKVYSLVGDTLCMEYIEKTDEPTINQMEFIIDRFKEVPEVYDFSTYVDRIKDHLNIYKPSYMEFIIEKLNENSTFYNNNKSFCHGDMSLDNMINNNRILYLIDPIKPKGLYSSWLLDVAKILHSSYRFNQPFIYLHFMNKYKDISDKLILLEITHWIRMRKYSNDKQTIDDRIEYLLKELNVK